MSKRKKENKSKKEKKKINKKLIIELGLLVIVLVVIGIIILSNKSPKNDENINNINNEADAAIYDMLVKEDLNKLVIYPGRDISIESGREGGFAFSIKNLEHYPGIFSSNILYIDNDCDISKEAAESYISSGKTIENLEISEQSILETPVLVKFDIPENLPNCEIIYRLNVKKGISLYAFENINVNILGN
jgi:hypothetical protein